MSAHGWQSISSKLAVVLPNKLGFRQVDRSDSKAWSIKEMCHSVWGLPACLVQIGLHMYQKKGTCQTKDLPPKAEIFPSSFSGLGSCVLAAARCSILYETGRAYSCRFRHEGSIIA